jgi:hypothetical protein
MYTILREFLNTQLFTLGLHKNNPEDRILNIHCYEKLKIYIGFWINKGWPSNLGVGHGVNNPSP